MKVDLAITTAVSVGCVGIIIHINNHVAFVDDLKYVYFIKIRDQLPLQAVYWSFIITQQVLIAASMMVSSLFCILIIDINRCFTRLQGNLEAISAKHVLNSAQLQQVMCQFNDLVNILAATNSAFGVIVAIIIL